MTKVKKNIIGTALACLFLTSLIFAGQDLVFFGVTGNDAPAIEKAFDRRVRDALSVGPEYRLWDYMESQDFRRRIGFDEYPVVSRKLVESLRHFSNDSVVFAWVTVKSMSIKPRRVWVVGSEITGEITLTLSVYSLRFRDYTFIGDVSGSVKKWKELIGFYPLDRGTHITAIDRSEITGKLIDETAYRAADMISAVVKSEKRRAEKGLDTTYMGKRREPTISDMFNMPSVGGAAIETGRRKTSAPVAPVPEKKVEPEKAPAPAVKPKPEKQKAEASKPATAKETPAAATEKPAAAAEMPVAGTEKPAPAPETAAEKVDTAKGK